MSADGDAILLSLVRDSDSLAALKEAAAAEGLEIRVLGKAEAALAATLGTWVTVTGAGITGSAVGGLLQMLATSGTTVAVWFGAKVIDTATGHALDAAVSRAIERWQKDDRSGEGKVVRRGRHRA